MRLYLSFCRIRDVVVYPELTHYWRFAIINSGRRGALTLVSTLPVASKTQDVTSLIYQNRMILLKIFDDSYLQFWVVLFVEAMM